MPNTAKVAIVAALQREVRPLIKKWRPVERDYDGRTYTFFENERAVLVCGGIGPEAARRATEAVINLYAPVLVQSAGFAGALDATLKVGTVLTPICVIDAKDGSHIEAGVGHWVLVSVDRPASVKEKARLAEAYWAHAVDMEAAAVARAAHAHDITFVGLKAISDKADFEMPPMERFVGSRGQFRTLAFAGFVAVRPWLWLRVAQLAKNSSTAAAALCEWLAQYDQGPDEAIDPEPDLRPTTKGSDSLGAAVRFDMAIAGHLAIEENKQAIPATMLAAVYRGVNDVRLETVPVPKIGPGELLVRVHTCGVCGTDLKKIATGSHSAPRIFGHETSGMIAAVGAGVRDFKPGDRVVVFHHVPCADCYYCRHKTFAQCDTYKKVGCTAGFEPSGGGFAEYVRVMDWITRRGTIRIPATVSYEQACFVEPINTCMKGIERLGLQPGETVVVIGQGPIGIMLSVLAKRAGSTVVTSDLYPQRLTISISYGLGNSIDASRTDVVKAVRGMTEGRGADAAILAVGANGLIRTAMDAVRPGGRVLLFAQTVHGDATFDPGSVCVDEKAMLGSYSASVDLQEASVRFVMNREMDLERLISHRFSLSSSVEALNLAAHTQPDSMKIAIQPGSSWEGIRA